MITNKYSLLFGFLIIIGSCLMAFVPAPNSGNITLIFKNVQTSKGNLLLGLYKDQASFKKEQPFKKIVLSKQGYSNHQVKTSIDLPKGTYGIAILDDENENRKMDYSFGFPQEGYGFSNYQHKGWTRPDFSKFDFYHNGEHTTVQITVQYF